MLSIIAPMICYKNTLVEQAGRESDGGRQAAAAGHAIQIAHRLQSINTYYRAPLSPRISTQNTTLSFLLFIVIVCFEAQTVPRQCARRCDPMGAFKCRNAVICFIHSLLGLKVGLCRHLTELGPFRFGSGQFARVDAF